MSDTQHPTLPTTFDPAEIEARWYAHWETNGCFRPERPEAEAFTIVNPPPNVTGSLHIGHALDNTLQDVVIRYERLRGKDALWVVGMDHAGRQFARPVRFEELDLGAELVPDGSQQLHMEAHGSTLRVERLERGKGLVTAIAQGARGGPRSRRGR